MFLQFSILTASFLLLVLGAEGLVRGSASLALRLGLTPLVVGLTVVAFGTSAPELVVSLNAVLADQGDIAVGNVVGSNILNIGVILGLTALLCPIRIALPVLKFDAPLVLLATLLAAGILSRGTVGSGVGILLVACLIAYTGFTVRHARSKPSEMVAAEFEEGVPSQSAAWWMDGLFIIGGLAILIVGSRFLVASSSIIARSLGVSEAIIGLTIVAAGTSMPELATSVLAAIRRQPDIAIGNILGSNLFNILGILGITATVHPISAPGIGWLGLGTMVAFSAVLLPLLWTDKRLQRWEGILLVAGYLAYLALLWPRPAIPA